MAKISIAEVDQAEARLQSVKEGGKPEEIKKASQEVADLRRAFREQEVASGQRAAGAGVGPGDAAASPDTIDTGTG